MSDEKNLPVESEEEDDMEIITLTDQEGNEVEFELLDVVPYENEEYLVLAPVEPGEVDNVEIFRIEADPESDEESYFGLDSEEELEAVYEEFKKRNADLYDFAD
ncbi:MAG: DUF1292 domain-containing protein [Lachnospiraceae bacterium]|nr:DUF1292 domain-containing protein [Lachnospiraceae bacterium]